MLVAKRQAVFIIDVAIHVYYIASDEAKLINGQTHIIDGGRGLEMKGAD